MSTREENTQEILRLIRHHRQRIPEDVLDRAQKLALGQLKQQQEAAAAAQLEAQGKVLYDREAAKSVIETFLSKYDEGGKFANLLRNQYRV